jgi:hypothetical protein
VCPSAADYGHRIAASYARPAGGERSNTPVVVLVVHPVLAPGVLVVQQLKLPPMQRVEGMGNREKLLVR